MIVVFSLAKTSFYHLYVISEDLIILESIMTWILRAEKHSVNWNLKNSSEIKRTVMFIDVTIRKKMKTP
jgi:hypothetical protein